MLPKWDETLINDVQRNPVTLSEKIGIRKQKSLSLIRKTSQIFL